MTAQYALIQVRADGASRGTKKIVSATFVRLITVGINQNPTLLHVNVPSAPCAGMASSLMKIVSVLSVRRKFVGTENFPNKRTVVSAQAVLIPSHVGMEV